MVAACGVRPPSFPSDLSDYSVKDLSRDQSVRRFLKDVASLLKVRFTPPSNRTVAKVVTAANTGYDGWHLVQPALVGKAIGGSPFELRTLLKPALRSAFLISQSLWRLTKGPHARAEKRALFDFLERTGTSARILVQAAGPGVEAWNSLLPNFGSDLAASLGELRKWLTEAQRLQINKPGRPRLIIKVAPLIPFSCDIVDAELASGVMVIRHTLHRAGRSADRPVFALQGGARENQVFGCYFDCWNEAFNEAAFVNG